MPNRVEVAGIGLGAELRFEGRFNLFVVELLPVDGFEEGGCLDFPVVVRASAQSLVWVFDEQTREQDLRFGRQSGGEAEITLENPAKNKVGFALTMSTAKYKKQTFRRASRVLC